MASQFTARPNDTFAQKLANLALSGVQVISIQTTEETRVLGDIRRAAELAKLGKDPAWNVLEWDFQSGFSGFPRVSKPCVGNPLDAVVTAASNLLDVRETADEPPVRAAQPGRVTDVGDDYVVVDARRYEKQDFAPVVTLGQLVKPSDSLLVPRCDTTFIVLKDVAQFLNCDDPRLRRLLRNLFETQELNNRRHRRVIILLGPTPVTHPEVAYLINALKYSLPTEEDLLNVVDEIAAGAGETAVEPGLRRRLASALTGFAHHEACDALALCVTVFNGLNPRNPAQAEEFSRELLREVHYYQAAAWENDRVLSLHDTATVANFEDVGGYDLFMDWMKEVELCYSEVGVAAGLAKPKGALLAGVPGCVSGDTVVRYKRGNRTSASDRCMTVKEFHDRFHGIPVPRRKKWMKTDTYLHSFCAESGRVFYNRVVDVIAKGVRPCLRVTTRKSGQVTLTADHPVLTADGTFKAAGQLTVGDKLLVRGSMKPRKGDSPPPVRRARVVVEGLKYHPTAWPKLVTEPSSGKVYEYGRTHRARLVFEAHLNALTYDEFVEILKHDEAKAADLQYLEHDEEVHHINEDPSDDRLENLLVMIKADHTRLHCDEGRFNCEYTAEDEILAIEPAGEQVTYDISMEFPTANFATHDGIIVHNTGKTLVGFMLAKILKLPLIVFNISSVYGSLLGASEAVMDHALNRISAKGPCVVLIDEMDKALGGIKDKDGRSSSGDSGVSLRVMGKLLSWQANVNKSAFLIGTLNHTDNLPPELLRPGRFDRLYFVDVPTEAEREEILAIHLRKRGVNFYDSYNPGERLMLLEATDGFVGGELEQAVIDAIRRQARVTVDANEELVAPVRPSVAVLLTCLREMTPSSKGDAASTVSIQASLAGRARPVSNSAKKQAKTVTISRPRRSRSVGGGDLGSN